MNDTSVPTKVPSDASNIMDGTVPYNLNMSSSRSYETMVTLPPIGDEDDVVAGFIASPAMNAHECEQSQSIADELVRATRRRGGLGMMEQLMAAFSLLRPEGRKLMELAEAYLRIPDGATRDELIADKIVGSDWRSTKARGWVLLVAWSLGVASAVLEPKLIDPMRRAIRSISRPFIRTGTLLAMRVMGGQFVLARSIEAAMDKSGAEAHTLYSFDMLGEAARTSADAQRYFNAYSHAISVVSAHADHAEPNDNNGISVKLSALSCHYKSSKWPELQRSLYPLILSLAVQARTANISLTIDAEEAARLELSLSLVRDLMHAPELAGWDGLGVVVQAYGRRAGAVIDALDALCVATGRKISVRLVKGAYWDAEVKIAQEKGLESFPVYRRKVHTDLAYLHHARQLLGIADRVYPQFATHNAATLAAVEVMARTMEVEHFEVQRLHGMGVTVHEAYRKRFGRRLRIYAPVGRHDDLLAYLVRRLLENGANASFIHKLSDPKTDLAQLSQDPYAQFSTMTDSPPLRTGEALFAPQRANSKGWDIDNPAVLAALQSTGFALPPRPKEPTPSEADQAFSTAQGACEDWVARGAEARASVLDKVADTLEAEAQQIFTLLAQEAGKTIDDAIAELREAVDFCRYYAAEARQLPSACRPRGVVLAISPWNFPLAIFTGQIAAALAAGNTVIAKPAEQTPRIAALAVQLMHHAGVPRDVMHILCGPGETLGAHLTQSGQADMVVFTGSTETARRIGDAIANSAKPCAPLLAETGGLNAMIVDSSALLERAVDDIIASAFRSAGQRCSALRILYVQDDIYDPLMKMLIGAAADQTLGDPLDFSVDIGPVIDAEAKADIDGYVEEARASGRLIWQGVAPDGLFCAPAMIKLPGIAALEREVFGPVLHIARYPAGQEAQVIADVNARGYGLTFGMHTRIEQRYKACASASAAGNVYINRNQIGAIVGSQPFGGHGLSGTGPKAGGPLYLGAFTLDHKPVVTDLPGYLPGPDGEENFYSVTPRGRVLCLEPNVVKRKALVARVAATGNEAIGAAEIPETLDAVSAVMVDRWGSVDLASVRRAIAVTPGALIPMISDDGGEAWLYLETHRCVDLTASGGNVELLARAN